MTMRVGVTGGAGMIGTRLVGVLGNLGHETVVIDNLWRGTLRNLESIENFDIAADFHEIDLADPAMVSTVKEIFASCDAVIHLADVVAGIQYVFNNQYEIFRLNNTINTNVFRACAEAAVPRVLYAGTACSFPKGLQLSLESVLREDQMFPAEPESAYGWSKLMGSLELQYMAERYGTSTTTLILHNVYGPHCDIDPRTSQVIPSLIRKMLELGEGEALTVWGSGRQGRAFLHVDDAAAAFVAALDKENLPPFIQIGPGHCTSIGELVEMLRDRVLQRPIAVEYDTTQPEGDIGRCADFSLAASVLDWSPRVDLEDGLRETLHWIEAQVASSV